MAFVWVIERAGSVIEGAGGILTDWQGRALGRGSAGRVIAAGDPRVHAEVLELLALTDH